MNAIPEKQNSDHALWLMRARQRTYANATTLQVLQLIATVALPAILGWIAVSIPATRAPLAAASLILLLLDIFVLDRAQLYFLRRAAKIAEQFDCEVLDLSWNGFIADPRLDSEDIEAAAAAYPGNARALAVIRDWYPRAVGRAPLHVGRIVCQLANMRYDAKLRRRYAMVVCVLPGLVLLAALAALATFGLAFEAVVLSILVPATPVTVWALREAFRHNDAAAAQERIKDAVEALWSGIARCSAEECTIKAREFQDAIYQRRVSSPLVFPLVYHLLRDKMESQMNKGAEERLVEAGYQQEEPATL